MLVQNVLDPWLIVEDFNAILSPKNRLAGAPVTLNEIRDFAECIKNMGINEIQWKGNYYTWYNKQIGNARIQVGLIELLGMIHGWTNGVMLL